ncbi:MAG: lipid-A-disaccharide synthase N-terminal domain-containing protein [Opitutales bacterium]
MDRVVYDGFIVLTPWKALGLLGAGLFGGRWIVQIIVSTIAKRPVIPRVFWLMSLTGSLLALSYFIFGKNDSVGIVQNLPGVLVAGYNLFLDITSSRRHAPQPPAPEPDPT